MKWMNLDPKRDFGSFGKVYVPNQIYYGFVCRDPFVSGRFALRLVNQDVPYGTYVLKTIPDYADFDVMARLTDPESPGKL